ncbi:heme A synthase [Tropicibacter naphthalenivorans]|uniref:Heme A synthase n=1 Tax=Tropicibacter naphthalenivorans TaxID=441103 RepID=A0A0P1G828_9RHOB|nr:heme A synthase [Tropicibacter naphthalenivorans]CUH77670.1 Heme A synthase [Tropicibacter naphthalenivorans]SMC54418.1 cytochrome c oxidase assembly protein subunit 15 [Tropicibacter naphthalenivorans]
MAEKRKLFEEVGQDTPARTAPAGGMIDANKRGARGAIRAWLMVLFALVMVMIAVGGLTRLTDSGLSITEWKPITGAIPPMSAEAWDSEFAKYKEIPEYQLQNKGMSLSEFKSIYWWEWGHRQLGRVIGLVWAVGFFGFWAAKRIPAGWTGRLFGIGVLGGLQGAVGWWMVHSGLGGQMLDVASYRLATHLGLAFVILGFIAWFVFSLGREERELMQARRLAEVKLFKMSTGLLHFAFLQILLGALVAGIDAGRSFNDWPLMAGGFFPPYPFDLDPVWRNFFENAGLVQFMHRMAGYLLMAFGIVVWLRGRRSAQSDTRFRFNAVLAMLIIQMLLGIVTVVYLAPWQVAILHQIGAVVLWVLILRARFAARYPVQQSIRG